MNVEPLPPVPSPPEHHWRQFRINLLPLLTCAGMLIVAVWLWGRNLANPLVMGQAESLEADVSSPLDGRIVRMNVQLFQPVKTGDVIAVIERIQPEILSNSVAVVRAELESVRANAGLDAGDRTRLANFQLNWMIRRTELAATRAQLIWAKAEYERMTQLAMEKYVSQKDLEVARRDQEQLSVEVDQRSQAVDAAEKTWRELNPATAGSESPGLKTALEIAEEKLRLAESRLEPIILTAQIDGCVSKIDKMSGAIVIKGDSIVKIASPSANKIVGYLSLPLRIEPTIGMKAQVRGRGVSRTPGDTQITYIGPSIELFDAPFRVRGMGSAQQRGLPIIMAIPPGMKIRPGELVDIRLLVN